VVVSLDDVLTIGTVVVSLDDVLTIGTVVVSLDDVLTIGTVVVSLDDVLTIGTVVVSLDDDNDGVLTFTTFKTHTPALFRLYPLGHRLTVFVGAVGDALLDLLLRLLLLLFD
jgi:hypothetical protein